VTTRASWLDLHMGPVTFQVLDQAGCLGAVALLRTAHQTAIQVCISALEVSADTIRAGRTVEDAFAT
jgi:hypothetical protein